jgi:hypothetical protein
VGPQELPQRFHPAVGDKAAVLFEVEFEERSGDTDLQLCPLELVTEKVSDFRLGPCML